MCGYYLFITVRRSGPTTEEFDSLLDWLSSDRERAGEEYENIRQSLIKIFFWRGINDPEDLADETINRVTSKVKDVRGKYQGDPALYFYGVAKKLMHEYLRAEKQQLPISSIINEVHAPYNDAKEKEAMSKALEECLEELSAVDRYLFLSYYKQDKKPKIYVRQKLSQQLGITTNNLRVRLHRIRTRLDKCIRQRLESYNESNLDQDT